MDRPTAQHQARHLQYQAASLLIYHSVLDSEIGQAFLILLQHVQSQGQAGEPELISLYAYGRWFRALADAQQSWQHHLMVQLLCADNPFTRQVQQGGLDALPAALVAAAQHDLRVLQRLYTCTSQQICEWVQEITHLDSPLVSWDFKFEVQEVRELAQHTAIMSQLEQLQDWADALEFLADYHHQFGAGLFAQYRALRWQSGQFVGIAHPDPIRLHELAGYAHPKAALIQNTKALLAGHPALHVLLYGSRGSGKSSLVKALLHEFGDRGLRLIEVSKSDLTDLPRITDQLRNAPQRFIIFVDDLSFEDDDDAYKALKVVLEGNLTARPPNVIVYATSNRRHLIREFFGDRPRPSDADEIHHWDTVQEKLSFSDRFGLTLTFEPASQATYLDIVHHLAQQANLTLSPDALEQQALQWATRHNGRSGRTARQFIDFLRSTEAG